MRLCAVYVYAGESVAVLKRTEAVGDPNCELQAKENMLFSSTAISNGTTLAVVTATGMATEIGKIQSQIKVCVTQRHRLTQSRDLTAFFSHIRTGLPPMQGWTVVGLDVCVCVCVCVCVRVCVCAGGS